MTPCASTPRTLPPPGPWHSSPKSEMYIFPPLPSATSPGPQKPADVAGPPSPNSLPPPATRVIIPNITSVPAGGERSERDAVELAVFAGLVDARRFSSPPHATTAPDIATISNRERWRTQRRRCARLHKQVLSKPRSSVRLARARPKHAV